MSWRRSAHVAMAAAMLMIASVVVPESTSALGEVISVRLAQTDGTPDPPSNTWSADDSPGNDSGPANGIVRTNDELGYDVEVRVEGGTASNTTISMELPVGVEATSVPPFCVAGSSISPVLAPPDVPVTATSWTALASQTLTCNVGERAPGSTLSYPFTARVRSEVPHGTALDPVVASVISDDLSAPALSNPVNATVSARAKYDLSKNAVSPVENGGYLGSRGITACPGDPARQCFTYLASILISAQDGGKGSTPLASPIVITDDLSPDALYGSPNGFPVTTDPDFVAAGANALDIYGARLSRCPAGSVYTAPGFAAGGTLTTTNAVRDSGTITCTQPGGPGTPVIISIADADTSAYTVPTESSYPDGNPLAADQGYVVAGRIDFSIPVDAVRDLGVAGADGRFDLRWDNTYTDFDATGIDGTPNDPTADLAFNNHRALNASIRTRGSWSKAFYGLPNAVGNTPPREFNPGNAQWEGPTNATSLRSGDGVILPGQRTISGLYVTNVSSSGGSITHLICDNWDNTALVLAPGNYGPSTARLQRISSGGEAVWYSGYHTNGVLFDDGDAGGVPALEVEYGTGPAGAGETCEDSDSPDGWVTDPTSLPGGIASVSKVRITTVLPASSNARTLGTISIALEALPNPSGTIAPNWASGKTEIGSLTMAEMLADPSPWRVSTYDPVAGTGSLGDRLNFGAAIARLDKEVFDEATSSWVTTTPAVTGDTDVAYRLSPTLTSGLPTSVTTPVVIDDCLPASQTYVIGSANTAPTLIQFGAPGDARLACPAGQTFVRWDLGPQTIGSAITPIVFSARVSADAPSGVYTNNAVISADGDPSAVAQRSASVQVQVIQPTGVAISKVALTPQLDVNPAGEASPGRLLWSVGFRNLDLPGELRDVDLIDLLPANGVDGSSFEGTLAFESAMVTSGTGIDMLYTSQQPALLSMDGNDPTNDPTGSTIWCDRPVAGLVVSGAGVAADCPQSNEDVTGLRFLRPGVFAPNERFEIEVSLIPTDNAEGDVYVNQVAGRAEGLALMVGPVEAPELIIASSLGNRVWRDVNGDGVQNTGEPGIDGVTVELWGTDTDGNAVASSSVPLRTVTSLGGLYRFDDLPSGTYSVRFDDSIFGPGDAWTVSDAGSDDLVDSDADTSTGEAVGIVLASNTDLVSVDQGIVRRPTLSGFAFDDADNNGDRTGDTGIGGVSIDLVGTDNTGNPVAATVTTNPDGSYSFPDLWPGDYTITQDRSTVPQQFLDGRDTAGSLGGTVTDGEGVADDVIAALLLSDTDSIENNFGELNSANVNGVVFNDESGDGSFTMGEAPIGGVTIDLTGIDDLGNSVALSTVSAGDGSYAFTGLRPGAYTVTQTQPLLWVDGGDEAGSAGGIVFDDAVTGIVLSPGTRAVGYNFGERAFAPSISLTKSVNGEDANAAPGVLVDIGSPVVFEFEVTNTGNLELVDVDLSDDIIGAITCPADRLAVGASMVCTADDTAIEGPYVNVGTVSGQPLDPGRAVLGDRIETSDPAHYFGADVGIDIVKRVNGDDANSAPGPTLTAGETATFTYEISNTGGLDLVDLDLVDDVLGPITCPDRLDVGQTVTCQAQAPVERGAYVNVGTATAQPVFVDASGVENPVGEVVAADDAAHYYGEAIEMSLIKRVDGWDANDAAIVVEVGDRLSFTYEVTNSGNVDLAGLVVDDDVLGAISCPATDLAAGVTIICTHTTLATSGTVTNIGTATASRGDGVVPNVVVSSTDPATYTARNPGRDLPSTGSATGNIVLLGLSLLVAGVGVLTLTRRRQQEVD